MITKEQLEKFVKARNASPHITNLQFMIDADSCGIPEQMFEHPQKIKHGYLWRFKEGVVVEQAGRLMGRRFTLHPAGTEIDADTGEPIKSSR